MELVVAHKGKKAWRCRVRGHEAHSSLTPHGVNAVQIACEIVTYLTGMARAFRDNGPFDAAYDVPYTTVHTGLIRGGTALNIVPRDCSFDFEIRHLPFDDPDELMAEVDAYAQRFLPEMHKVADAGSSSNRYRRCRLRPGRRQRSPNGAVRCAAPKATAR
jgi:acetylornithine deacetylase